MARNYENPADRPIGSTFTASSSIGNSKLSVVANGQTLNKADYPELVQQFSNQSFENVGNISFTQASTGGNFAQAVNNYKLTWDSTSTYFVYAQTTRYGATSNLEGPNIWTTSNGDDWTFAYGDTTSGTVQKVVAIGTDVFVCCNNAILKTSDGLTFTKVMSSGAYDITSNGTTYLIITTSNTAISTTNFVSFTSVGSTGVGGTLYGCVYMAPNFIVTGSGANTLRYSSDLVTWASSANNMSYVANENRVRVVNNTFISFPNQDGVPFYVYATDPVSGSFSNAGRNYNSSNNNSVMGIYYDSALSSYIIATARVSSMFGYVISNLSQSGNTYENSSNVENTNESVIYKFGSNCYRACGYHYTKKTTTWTTGTFAITNSDVIPNPFTSPNQIGWVRAGTTFLGNRWISKAIGSTSSTVYHTAFVENSGVFKYLYFASTDPWIQSSGTANLQSACVYEDSTGYAWIAGAAGSNYYYASFNTSRQVLNRSSGSAPAANTSFFVPVKDVGIQIHEMASNSTRTIYVIKPTTVASTAPQLSAYTMLTTSTVAHVHVSFVDNEILILELNSTASTSPAIYIIKNGQLIFRTIVSLFNSSGSAVTVTNTLKIWKLNGVYFASQSGGLYSSTNGAVYTQIGYVDTSASNVSSSVEYGKGLAIGQYVMKSTGVGSSTFTAFVTGTATTQGVIGGFFKISNDTAYVAMTGGGFASLLYKTPFDVSTQFTVPEIPSTTAGQSTCIVAR